jgi:hypothetical protein
MVVGTGGYSHIANGTVALRPEASSNLSGVEVLAGIEADRATGMRWCRTFDAGGTSWRLRSRRNGGCRRVRRAGRGPVTAGPACSFGISRLGATQQHRLAVRPRPQRTQQTPRGRDGGCGSGRRNAWGDGDASSVRDLRYQSGPFRPLAVPAPSPPTARFQPANRPSAECRVTGHRDPGPACAALTLPSPPRGRAPSEGATDAVARPWPPQAGSPGGRLVPGRLRDHPRPCARCRTSSRWSPTRASGVVGQDVRAPLGREAPPCPTTPMPPTHPSATAACRPRRSGSGWVVVEPFAGV